MKRSYFVAALAVAIVISVAVLAVPEAQPLAQAVLDPSSWSSGIALAIGAAVPMTSKSIRALQVKKTADVKVMRAITDAAGGNPFSAEDQAKYDGLKARLEDYNAAIFRETELLAEEAQLGVLEVPGGARIEVHERAEDDPKRGFKSAGEFFQAVKDMPGQRNGFALNGQLHVGAAAPSTFGNEGAGSDGGFAVPPQYSQEIYTHSLEKSSLLPLTDNDDITGNSMVYPKDETTPWGTDGIRGYWQAEATAATLSKPKLSTTTLRLQKLMALVPLTDELVADGIALGGYITKKVGDSIRWKMNEAILFGLGNGTPQGAFNGNAAIVQAKDSGQATLTLSALNLANMISRLPEGSYGDSIWMVNNNVLPALFTLTLSNYPIYLPAGGAQGGIQGNPYGTVLGRPLMVTQHAKSFTSQGDVLLMDPTYYRTITKAGGVQTATSIHIYFDADVTAFRTTFRVDGQPKIVNPINPANGSTTLSPFVQLAAR